MSSASAAESDPIIAFSVFVSVTVSSTVAVVVVNIDESSMMMSAVHDSTNRLN